MINIFSQFITTTNRQVKNLLVRAIKQQLLKASIFIALDIAGNIYLTQKLSPIKLHTNEIVFYLAMHLTL